jgi:hypothetical protein
VTRKSGVLTAERRVDTVGDGVGNGFVEMKLPVNPATIQGPIYKTFLRPQFTNVGNKLECLSVASLYALVQCLSARPGAYPRVEHLKADSKVGCIVQ